MITELRRWREQSGLTQAEAALRLGISQTYFSLLERGARPMTDGLRRRLGAVRAEQSVHAEGARSGILAGGDAVELDLGRIRERSHELLELLSPERLILVGQLLEVIASPTAGLDE